MTDELEFGDRDRGRLQIPGRFLHWTNLTFTTGHHPASLSDPHLTWRRTKKEKEDHDQRYCSNDWTSWVFLLNIAGRAVPNDNDREMKIRINYLPHLYFPV